MEDEIFENSQVNFNKLIKYGFKKENNNYIYETLINKDKFKVIIIVDINSKVSGKIIDLKLNEEYLNYRIQSSGAFSNSIREEFIKILNDIKENCFIFDKKVNSWVIPSNPNLFDIESYFNIYDSIIWHQKLDIEVNDFVYIYVGKPYSCLKYKCLVTRTNFKDYAPRCMELKLLNRFESDEYPLDFLKKAGLTVIRFARKMPKELSEYLYDR